VFKNNDTIIIQEASVKFEKSEYIKRQERIKNLKMSLIIVVDTEDEEYKSCMKSINQMFNNIKSFKDISDSLFIINGNVL
jgi:hypothetical protein